MHLAATSCTVQSQEQCLTGLSSLKSLGVLASAQADVQFWVHCREMQQWDEDEVLE